jgi:predicted RNA-binding protein
MELEKTEIVLEGVLKVMKNGELVAVVHNDMGERSQIFYACKRMGIEDIKILLESINK